MKKIFKKTGKKPEKLEKAEKTNSQKAQEEIHVILDKYNVELVIGHKLEIKDR